MSRGKRGLQKQQEYKQPGMKLEVGSDYQIRTRNAEFAKCTVVHATGSTYAIEYKRMVHNQKGASMVLQTEFINKDEILFAKRYRKKEARTA